MTDLSRICRQFDKRSLRYESIYSNIPNSLLHQEKILRSDLTIEWGALHLSSSKNSKVLDVGCGLGNILRRLYSISPDIKALGIDISSGMIEKAKNNIALLQSFNFNIKHQVIEISDCINILSSSLTNQNIDIPEGLNLFG